MKSYLYPGINLESGAMPPKLANSVDPLAAAVSSIQVTAMHIFRLP